MTLLQLIVCSFSALGKGFEIKNALIYNAKGPTGSFLQLYRTKSKMLRKS